MKIGNNLEVLELNMGDMGGMPMIVHLTLVWDEHEGILVDAADPFKYELIRKAVENAGLPFNRLTRIIITHHDMDHIGSLESLVKGSGNKIKIMAHKLEEPYITGEKPSIKFTPERMEQIKKEMESAPQDRKKAMEQMFAKRDIKISAYLNDGDELPFCGGIKVIHTPGHTPGHICLYLEKYKALVAGDAMNVIEGRLSGPSPEHTYRMEEALESMKKFTRYDIETIICYHGGIYKDNPNLKISELINLNI